MTQGGRCVHQGIIVPEVAMKAFFYVHVGALSVLKLCGDGACVVWVCDGDNSGESL